jgi:hypothetical protein
MAQGKPKKWVTATVSEQMALGKRGLKVIIWEKWGKTRRGTAIISVGGIRWYPYMAKKPYKKTWDELSAFFEQ